MSYPTLPTKLFKMAEEDYDKIIKACTPVPLIMLQHGMPSSQQENANNAWKELGSRLGFDGMSVKQGPSKLEFYATPTYTPASEEALLDEFTKLVNAHDLTYAYSDDGGVYRRGEQSLRRIKAMAARIAHEEAIEIWNKMVDSSVTEATRSQFYWKKT